jgi:predicted DNA-binding ArsR family transcriptional regulator
MTGSNNRPKSKIIADPQKLFSFFATPSIEVTKRLSAADEVVWITWDYAVDQKIFRSCVTLMR